MKKTKNSDLSDYIKINRKLSREEEKEYSNGFVCIHKVHKNKKKYNRKNKETYEI